MLGDQPQPSAQGYVQLRYLLRCVNESMRLYPHPPVLLRRAQVADTLPGEAWPDNPIFSGFWWYDHCHLVVLVHAQRPCLTCKGRTSKLVNTMCDEVLSLALMTAFWWQM